MNMKVMTEVDRLVLEKFVPFRERLIDAVQGKHPHIFTMINALMAGKQNKVGLQVTEGGKIAGEYTFNLDGVRISRTDPGKLESEFHHPFLGIVRPYVVVERANMEKLIADETAFTSDLLPTISRHLPDLTIKFMR
ncbi:MAG: hypothetical protein P4N41_15555 [Negativicutes bacterium]|nr:hypothetical protein [Negativicutes bacterium]